MSPPSIVSTRLWPAPGSAGRVRDSAAARIAGGTARAARGGTSNATGRRRSAIATACRRRCSAFAVATACRRRCSAVARDAARAVLSTAAIAFAAGSTARGPAATGSGHSAGTGGVEIPANPAVPVLIPGRRRGAGRQLQDHHQSGRSEPAPVLRRHEHANANKRRLRLATS